MKLYVVGFGAGSAEGMTLEAKNALEKSEVVVGYTVYCELLKAIFPEKKFYSTGMREEKSRVLYALEQSKNRITALVCSGDAEVFGLAGLAFQLSENFPETDIEVVAGVTAALSGGAALGAPLTNDFAVISLSDLLTPAEKIEARIRCAAQADFVIVLYNPASKKRRDALKKACEIALEYRSPDTVCGVVKNIGRDGENRAVMLLRELLNFDADMFTTVFIGNSETQIIRGKMVTPRGYRDV